MKPWRVAAGEAAVLSAAVAAARAAGIEEAARGAAGAAVLGAERKAVDESERNRETCQCQTQGKFF